MLVPRSAPQTYWTYPPGQAPLESLPAEILQHILSYLDRKTYFAASKVSHALKEQSVLLPFFTYECRLSGNAKTDSTLTESFLLDVDYPNLAAYIAKYRLSVTPGILDVINGRYELLDNVPLYRLLDKEKLDAKRNSDLMEMLVSVEHVFADEDFDPTNLAETFAFLDKKTLGETFTRLPLTVNNLQYVTNIDVLEVLLPKLEEEVVAGVALLATLANALVTLHVSEEFFAYVFRQLRGFRGASENFGYVQTGLAIQRGYGRHLLMAIREGFIPDKIQLDKFVPPFSEDFLRSMVDIAPSYPLRFLRLVDMQKDEEGAVSTKRQLLNILPVNEVLHEYELDGGLYNTVDRRINLYLLPHILAANKLPLFRMMYEPLDARLFNWSSLGLEQGSKHGRIVEYFVSRNKTLYSSEQLIYNPKLPKAFLTLLGPWNLTAWLDTERESDLPYPNLVRVIRSNDLGALYNYLVAASPEEAKYFFRHSPPLPNLDVLTALLILARPELLPASEDDIAYILYGSLDPSSLYLWDPVKMSMGLPLIAFDRVYTPSTMEMTSSQMSQLLARGWLERDPSNERFGKRIGDLSAQRVRYLWFLFKSRNLQGVLTPEITSQVTLMDLLLLTNGFTLVNLLASKASLRKEPGFHDVIRILFRLAVKRDDRYVIYAFLGKSEVNLDFANELSNRVGFKKILGKETTLTQLEGLADKIDIGKYFNTDDLVYPAVRFYHYFHHTTTTRLDLLRKTVKEASPEDLLPRLPKFLARYPKLAASMDLDTLDVWLQNLIPRGELESVFGILHSKPVTWSERYFSLAVHSNVGIAQKLLQELVQTKRVIGVLQVKFYLWKPYISLADLRLAFTKPELRTELTRMGIAEV